MNKSWRFCERFDIFDLKDFVLSKKSGDIINASFVLDPKKRPIVKCDFLYVPIFVGREVEIQHPTVNGLSVRFYLSTIAKPYNTVLRVFTVSDEIKLAQGSSL